MQKIFILFHRIDFDGICSMSVMRDWAEKAGMNVTIQGYTHGDPVPSPSHFEGFDKVAIVDICLPSEQMNSLYKSGKLIWVDHHVTSIQQSVQDGFDSAPGLRREGVGACELCWEFTHPGEKTPLFIELLSAYDVWDKTRYDWDGTVLPFQYGMRNQFNLNWEEFYNWFMAVVNENDLTEVDHVFQEGLAIIKYARQVGRIACNAYGVEVTVGGKLKGLALLTPHYGSLEMEESLIERGCQVAVCVNRNPLSGEYKVSVYAGCSDIGGFNLGAYMKEHYRGGGHRSAAGGTLTEKQFLRLVNKKVL